MSEKMEYSGSDVSQAIAHACKDMGVSQDQLKIEVLAAGSAGLFGFLGKKQARISVSLKAKKGKKAGGANRSREKTRGDRPARGSGRKSSGSRRAPEKAPAEITQQHLDEVKADLEKLLDLMGFPAPVEVSSQENKIRARIAEDHPEELIGREGQTIDSIQYLMRKIISRRIEGKVMFSLDAGDYREQRREELAEKALKLADEVRSSGRTMSIPALNPAERRIVHMTLQDDSTIRSRSVGEGQFKKILIYLPGQGKKRKSR